MDRAPQVLEEKLKAAVPGLALPARKPLFTRTGWTFFLAALVAVCALAPVMNLFVPVDSAFHMSDYAVALVGKIMCLSLIHI